MNANTFAFPSSRAEPTGGLGARLQGQEFLSLSPNGRPVTPSEHGSEPESDAHNPLVMGQSVLCALITLNHPLSDVDFLSDPEIQKYQEENGDIDKTLLQLISDAQARKHSKALEEVKKNSEEMISVNEEQAKCNSEQSLETRRLQASLDTLKAAIAPAKIRERWSGHTL